MRNRWLRIGLRLLFALSLLGNVLVLGLALRLVQIRYLAGLEGTALPRAVRAEVGPRLTRDADVLVAARRLGEARRAMLAAAEARPFDRAAVEAAMAEVRTATAALQVEGQRVLLDAFADAER